MTFRKCFQFHFSWTWINISTNSNKINYPICWQILNSSHYGIPQNRKRISIVAIKKGAEHIEKFEFPEANLDKIFLKDIGLPNKWCTHLMIQKTMPFFWTRNFNTIVPELKPIRVGFIKKARPGERIYKLGMPLLYLEEDEEEKLDYTGSKLKFVDFILMNVNNFWAPVGGLLPICSQWNFKSIL